MSFSKRSGTDAVCYTKPLDSLKGWNDHFFWVDTFACPALFSWHTGKSVSRDSVPKSSKFNAEHYATLVAYPDPFHKYPEPFLCLIGMSRNYSLDENTVGERERDEGEPKLLETTVGHVVPLLPVSPDRSSGDLEVSVDKFLIREGVVNKWIRVILQTKVVDAGEPSHPAKKLRGDYEALGVSVVGGKSQSAVQRLLDGAVQHAEVRGGAIPTLPFVSSSVSITPERVGGDYTEFLAGDNLVPLKPLKEKLVSALVFGGDSSSAGGSHPISSDFSDRTGGDFLVGGIRTIVDPDSNL
uniref:Uncharacterized protein n=1 Tax=Tanacetum cinerariifolium TaxID=118510 RepID=A0A6L2K3B7_TANCI|nr:hypothetical protein [Tanacetum cinerariifolium]